MPKMLGVRQIHRGGGKNEKYYSGSGSHSEYIINPYMNLLVQLIVYNNVHKIVEIGCGDFWIMRHILGFFEKNNYNYTYDGIDVVDDLIEYNNNRFANERIKFYCMDATQDDQHLPNGDMVIIRQVLQHLSNENIKKILLKANDFKFAFITEHLFEGDGVVYNVEKPTNGGIRLSQRSGVYLEHSPYNYKNIVHLLKVPEYGGIIRSSLIINT